MKKDLNHIPNECKIKAALLMELVEKEFNITKDEIMSKSRKELFIEARCMCYYILHRVELFGPTDISGVFNKDHSSVIHGIKIHKNLYETNHNKYKDKYDNLISTYLYKRDNDPNQNNIYSAILKIDEKRNKLSKIKNALTMSYLTGKQLKPEMIKIINEIVEIEDQKLIIENDIANRIKIK